MQNQSTHINTQMLTVQQALDIAIEYFQEDNLAEAKSLCNKILSVDSENPACYNLLGIIEAEEGQYQNAIVFFNRAISIKKDCSYFYNVGKSYKDLHKLDQAVDNFRLAISLDSSFPIIYFHLGMTLREQGKYKDATEVLRSLVNLTPSNLESLLNLGSILAEQNEHDEAIEYYNKVLALEPTHQSALYSSAIVLANQSRMSEAKHMFDRLLYSHPTDAFKIKAAWQIPVIAPSTQALIDWRNEFSSKINELIKSGLQIPDPLTELGKTNFYLAFQGFDNRELNNKVAQLMVSVCPSLTWTAPHCFIKRQTQGKIRVGFISNFFHLHSIGKTSRGLIAELSRDQFEVHSLFVPPIINDPISQLIQDSSDHYHILPHSLDEARKAISDMKLDILFYQDIGMEPFTFYLAFSRLAPLQCVSFGHPDTTGIDNVDYFISTDFFEIPDVDSDYSEKLIRLHNVGTPTYYYPPDCNVQVKQRSYFGLNDQTNLYFCPQTLFKFHPDFDSILADILNRDNQGVIVCLEAHIPHWTKLLKQRFQCSIGKAADRILFLPRQNFNDYLNLLAISDVVLDTIYFNGMNTTLEAFSVGTPVVTLPGQFQRGRHTLGMYRKMKIEDCVAHDPADYAKRAVRLTTDKKFRKVISSKIVERNSELFKDRQVIKQWEEFFTNALNASLD